MLVIAVTLNHWLEPLICWKVWMWSHPSFSCYCSYSQRLWKLGNIVFATLDPVHGLRKWLSDLQDVGGNLHHWIRILLLSFVLCRDIFVRICNFCSICQNQPTVLVFPSGKLWCRLSRTAGTASLRVERICKPFRVCPRPWHFSSDGTTCLALSQPVSLNAGVIHGKEAQFLSATQESLWSSSFQVENSVLSLKIDFSLWWGSFKALKE